MSEINCQFNNPVNLGIEELPDWEYSEMICQSTTTPSTTPLIELSDGTYTAYISPVVNLGDLFLMGFLIIVSGLLIFHFVWSFIFPQVWKLKTKLNL